MKNTYLNKFTRVWTTLMAGVVLLLLFSSPTVAQTITEIIVGTNLLNRPEDVAVDGSGNVYVTGGSSNNAFKITPGGVITEIIDATGDGSGNLLNGSHGITVDGSGNVYVTGGSSNAFKITPGGVITEIIDAPPEMVQAILSAVLWASP